MPRSGRPVPPALLALALCLGPAAAAPLDDAPPDARRNWFDDPFLAVTHGLPGCPVPLGPQLTAAQARAQAHGRVERGTSCFRDGRCRLPNAYLYDREIAPRVQRAVDADGGFTGTSVWVTVQRRWVFLEGCVARADQAEALERLVRAIDDVEQVVTTLQVGERGDGGPTPYPLAPAP